MTYFSIDLRNNYTLIEQYNNNKYLNNFYYVNKLLYTLILKKNVINILHYFELFFIVFLYVIILVTWDDYFRWSECTDYPKETFCKDIQKLKENIFSLNYFYFWEK